jgi:hypothetical protein
VLIFRLSSVLGGRKEVVNAPFIELLAYMEMQKEKEQNDRFRDFLNVFYANPMTDKNARKEYLKTIKPESNLLKVAKKKGALVTDLDQLRLIKQMQEQEANAEKLKGG